MNPRSPSPSLPLPPERGRFLNRDPIGESGGSNLYRFAGNDPVQNIDLWGLLTIDEIESYTADGENCLEWYDTTDLGGGATLVEHVWDCGGYQDVLTSWIEFDGGEIFDSEDWDDWGNGGDWLDRGDFTGDLSEVWDGDGKEDDEKNSWWDKFKDHIKDRLCDELFLGGAVDTVMPFPPTSNKAVVTGIGLHHSIKLSARGLDVQLMQPGIGVSKRSGFAGLSAAVGLGLEYDANTLPPDHALSNFTLSGSGGIGKLGGAVFVTGDNISVIYLGKGTGFGATLTTADFPPPVHFDLPFGMQYAVDIWCSKRDKE